MWVARPSTIPFLPASSQAMDAERPNGGGGHGNAPPGKGQQNVQPQPQPLIDRSDMGTAAVVLALLLLNMMHAAMTRCVC